MSNHAAYIKSWLNVFKGDNRVLITAASRGQQAVDFILESRETNSLNKSNPKNQVIKV